MTNSMKDLLLGLGFKPSPKPERLPKDDAKERPDGRGRPSPRADQRDPRQGRRDGSATPAQARRDAGSRDRAHRDERRSHPGGKRGDSGEIDLAKAYAIREQKEKAERIEAERQRQEAARIKREAKAKVAELLRERTLNKPDGELTRHFDYNGKIRRVHVDEAQMRALNAGELGVVQLDGRYLVVEAAIAREVRELLPSLVALLVDPDAPAADDPYADPRYAIPDDLVW